MDLRGLLLLVCWLTWAQASAIRFNSSTSASQLASLSQTIHNHHTLTANPVLLTTDFWKLDANQSSVFDSSGAASVPIKPSTPPVRFLLYEAPEIPVETSATAIRPSISIAREPSQPGKAAVIRTRLNIAADETSAPFLNITSAAAPSYSSFLATVPNDTEVARPLETRLASISSMTSQDIFSEPIDTKSPPPSMAIRHDHPVPRKGIRSKTPLQTNKFFANFFLEDQRAPVYTFPYSLQWSGGNGGTKSWGMSCCHLDADKRVFGPIKYNGAASYYINPIGIQPMVVSAKELGNKTTLTMDSITAFSARVQLSKDGNSPPAVSFPLVQGMAYVTAEFDGGFPMIQSAVFFKTVTRLTRSVKEHVIKYTFTLEDGTTWRVYAWRTKGDELDLQVVNGGLAESKKPFFGTLQVCKDPRTNGSEALLDDGAGIWPVTMALSGSASGPAGSYCFKYQKAGHQTGNLYIYALPHHIDSFSEETKQRVLNLQLQTTTKGLATLVRGAEWIMEEPKMPAGMSFSPWHPERGSIDKLSAYAKEWIHAAAAKEVMQNMAAQSDLDSMYFSGKALAKFATLLYVIYEMMGDKTLAQTGLNQLKVAFETFAANKQKNPLLYESQSDPACFPERTDSASYTTGDAGVDFGNTYYNDHHFHYGYHILAAATIGCLDPAWARAHADYVNTLARDIANPSARDTFFPTWRSFDWYHGHSWAHGLYAAGDGKNQESSSEDMMHAYALKMWGKVSGNANMEARGNLQLAVLARSLQKYYLYEQDNSVQPKQFIGNKVAGILFENKVDHTTFFDPHIEAIQGIHMIPILAPTSLVRTSTFVQQEWEAFFSKGRIDEISNAWKGIIYASYATVDPKKAWEFFSSPNFDPRWLDGGASLTWFMAYAAALAGI